MLLELALLACMQTSDYEKFYETPPDPINIELLTEFTGDQLQQLLEISGYPYKSETIVRAYAYISPDEPGKVALVFADSEGCLVTTLGKPSTVIERRNPMAPVEGVFEQGKFDEFVRHIRGVTA